MRKNEQDLLDLAEAVGCSPQTQGELLTAIRTHPGFADELTKKMLDIYRDLIKEGSDGQST
jgi:hypothetical protein